MRFLFSFEVVLLCFIPLIGCTEEPTVPAPVVDEQFSQQRQWMVERQLEGRDIVSTPVLQAMRVVPRHKFVPQKYREYAYQDSPLPIGEEQTISQPYVVALMTQLLRPEKDHKVLEVGTGSGYQAAVLAELVDQVYTIEIIPELSRDAARVLKECGYTNIHVRTGDGYKGWPEAAPFDGIIVTAAPDHIPQPLKEQLTIGGRLVIPVGERDQHLLVITRTKEGFVEERTVPVRFVPMTGKAQEPQ